MAKTLIEQYEDKFNEPFPVMHIQGNVDELIKKALKEDKPIDLGDSIDKDGNPRYY